MAWHNHLPSRVFNLDLLVDAAVLLCSVFVCLCFAFQMGTVLMLMLKVIKLKADCRVFLPSDSNTLTFYAYHPHSTTSFAAASQISPGRSMRALLLLDMFAGPRHKSFPGSRSCGRPRCTSTT